MFKKDREGFTLIELMVVMGVIILLLSMVFVAFGRVRSKGRETRVRAAMNDLAAIMESCATDNNGSYANCTAGEDPDVQEALNNIDDAAANGAATPNLLTADDSWCVDVQVGTGGGAPVLCRDQDGGGSEACQAGPPHNCP